MYIVVLKYMDNDYSLENKEHIAVLDTSDGTVELVSRDDMILLGLSKFKNIQVRDNKPYSLIKFGLRYALEYIDYSRFSVIRFEDDKFIFHGVSINYKDGADRLMVNYNVLVRSTRGASWNLIYAFWYCDHIVMRFKLMHNTLLKQTNEWYTVVINKKGEIQDYFWGNSPESAFAIKLDMVSGV